MGRAAKNISKETLIELYINQGLTQKEICKVLGIGITTTVTKYMRIHGIEPRDTNFERSLLYKFNLTEEDFKNELFKLYIGEQKSQNDLSAKYGVSNVIIARYLKKYKIPVRDHKTANHVNNTSFRNKNWRGGRKITPEGYITIYDPIHPRAINGTYVYEHRAVMEKHLGRYLEKDEHIHHINGNRLDNRIENLKKLTSSEHAKIHAITHVPYMNKKRLEKYSPQ